MSVFSGKYFDGITSAQHSAEVILIERLSELKFTLQNGETKTWLLDDISYENYGDYLEIKNSDNRMAFLRVDDKEFNQQFFDELKRRNKLQLHHRFTRLSLSKISIIAASLFALLIASYIFLVPLLAEKSVSFIPTTFDDYLGDVFVYDYFVENDVNEEKSEALEKFSDLMKFNNTHELKFKVVESETVNAFALPDGTIVLFSGLLDKMTDYEELAALLSHEVAHVNNRHTVKTLCRNLAGYMIISVVLSDVNGIMAVITENAHQLNSLAYSRKFEREADEYGANLLMENKIDPDGMITLLSRLQDEEKDKFALEFLTTHPITEERIKYIHDLINESHFKKEENMKLKDSFVKLKAIN